MTRQISGQECRAPLSVVITHRSPGLNKKEDAMRNKHTELREAIQDNNRPLVYISISNPVQVIKMIFIMVERKETSIFAHYN